MRRSKPGPARHALTKPAESRQRKEKSGNSTHRHTCIFQRRCQRVIALLLRRCFALSLLLLAPVYANRARKFKISQALHRQKKCKKTNRAAPGDPCPNCTFCAPRLLHTRRDRLATQSAIGTGKAWLEGLAHLDPRALPQKSPLNDSH